MKRNHNLDKWRGFTIISMVLFHLIYNINYFWQIDWYDGTIFNKIWQLSIACSFFIISGITSNFLTPERNIKRGIKTSLIGFAITVITYIAAPSQFILWGVLNGLGASIIITGLIQYFTDISLKWAIVFLLLFVISYKVPRGILYENQVFKNFYDLNFFYLGFPSNDFHSTDYFPIIPWVFIYIFGFYWGKSLKNKNFYGKYGRDSMLAKIGRYAMPIYLAHQIILYPLITLIYNFAK
ncbi:heparan-alpha-glucosaminide N-acetyltransferase domain-containing protein [uncultured Anaerococcus sp.]|uniref:heparan-alpha-glucosaminide N-acetyltransferase domain-containing protein n=1 Tax=uncultured Anaerococcus sp. TaxID=293428 RepID=UPI0025DEB198|nr:heparan-alpha-glucosaminide N-acetyltransferase domain-containing protein [uncultured Anaerococcus sp.]